LSPTAAEYCDGIDNDCDGLTDDADDNLVADATWYPDTDGDGYGDPTADTIAQCDSPEGHVRFGTDCNDADAAVSPAADEMCDLVDNDCDGLTDENDAIDASSWYRDGDGDGYGDGDDPLLGCAPPATFVADATDCDDGRASVNPGAVEDCDTALDDDCDGSTNNPDALNCSVFLADADGDTYGAGEGVCLCAAEAPYTETRGGDCDDTRSMVNPLAYETCATPYDDDCDDDTNDEGALSCERFYYDNDGDGDGTESYVCVCD
jgi:hypothetical protein